MEDGKIDIDGALAQGRTKAEFKSVVHRAVGWQDYVQTLPNIPDSLLGELAILAGDAPAIWD